MGVDFDPLEEGDALSATTLSTRFTDLVAAVNDVLPADIERSALQAAHLPALFDDSTARFSAGYGAWAADTALGDVYLNELPAVASAGHFVCTYQTFDNTAAGPGTPPYGPPTAPAAGTGWCIPQDAGTGVKAEIAVGGSAASLTTMAYAGLLVRFGGELVTGTATLASPANEIDDSVAIAIGFEDSTNTRYVVERSVRWFSLIAAHRGDIETSTFLKQTDLDAGNGTVINVFAVIASNVLSSASAALQEVSCQPKLQYFSIVVLPVHAGAL